MEIVCNVDANDTISVEPANLDKELLVSTYERGECSSSIYLTKETAKALGAYLLAWANE